MPSAEISDRELRLMRMRSQGLLPGSERRSVASATSAALAIQAQDVTTGLLGVRARTTGLTAARAARARGACRSWLMRNTLFLFAEKDLAWLRPTLAERPLTPALRRLEQEGVPPHEVERILGLIGERLDAGPTPRPELRRMLIEGGLKPGESNQRIYWTFHAAALRGVLAIRPPLEQTQTFAPTAPDEQLTREERLARLGRRYLQGHGPALPDDLAYWAKIPKGMAREAFELAGRTRIVPTSLGPMTSLASAADPPADPGRPVVRLLGSWDHWLLSWADRSLTLPHGERDSYLVSGRFLAYADGHAFASWKLERKPRDLTVTVTPFDRLPRGAREGLEAEVADLGRFYEGDAELRIVRP